MIVFIIALALYIWMLLKLRGGSGIGAAFGYWGIIIFGFLFLVLLAAVIAMCAIFGISQFWALGLTVLICLTLSFFYKGE